MQGVRERVPRIGRLYQVVRDDEPLSTDICIRWLVCTCSVSFLQHFANGIVAQLKVNLRPIWSPASEALPSLAQRFGDVVWDIVFSELQQPQGAHDYRSRWEQNGSLGRRRSWREPSAHRLRGAAATWLDRHHQGKVIISVRPVADARLTSH
jgi:U3 small nucleolar RNA-associated protein 20